MKRLILLVAALTMGMGLHQAQEYCFTMDEDGGEVYVLMFVDGDPADLAHLNVWDMDTASEDTGEDPDEMGLYIELGDGEDSGWHIEGPDEYGDFYWETEDPFIDFVEAGGGGDNEDCMGEGPEEPEEPAEEGVLQGLQIMEGSPGIDYAGRAVDGEVLTLLYYVDGEPAAFEQIGWCVDAGCMDSDCGWGIQWGDVPEGEPEGEAYWEVELGNDFSGAIIDVGDSSLATLTLDQVGGMMSIIALSAEGDAETASCLEIPWALAAPETSGAPVAGMLGLGLVAAACALGGAVTLRKK